MDDIFDVEDLRKLKLPELKNLCKQNSIPSSGTKETLVKRLMVSMGLDEEDEGVDEDALLEDDDDAVISSNGEKEDSVEPAAATETPPASDVAENVAEPTGEEVKEKTTSEPTDNVANDKENDTGESPTKKQKIQPPSPTHKPPTEMSDAERLKMRAEKYGTSKPSLSSKEQRAARFGLPAGNKSTPAGKGAAAGAKDLSPEDLEKMKQRGLRFGTSVSSTMTSADSLERIQKRKERFGVVTAPAATTGGKIGTKDDSMKQKRAERFGISTSTGAETSSTEGDDLKKKRAERFKL